jgi:hypothetical protein
MNREGLRRDYCEPVTAQFGGLNVCSCIFDQEPSATQAGTDCQYAKVVYQQEQYVKISPDMVAPDVASKRLRGSVELIDLIRSKLKFVTQGGNFWRSRVT